MNFRKDVCRPGILRVKSWDADYTEQIRKSLEQGSALPQKEEQLDYDLYAYGERQQAKLKHAYATIEGFLKFEEVRIIDYGCGQAPATLVYHDFLQERGVVQKVRQIILIEPSIVALRRASESCCRFYPDARIEVVAKDLSRLSSSSISCKEDLPTLHLFSDILNLDTFDLSHLSLVVRKIAEKCGYNQFVCVSPYLGNRNVHQKRIDLFHKKVDRNTAFHQEDYDKGAFVRGTDWTLSLRTFVIETPLHSKERAEKAQRRKEEEETNSWEKWNARLENCVASDACELYLTTCPKEYRDLLLKARRKRIFLERKHNQEIQRRMEWEQNLGRCVTLEECEQFIESCPKPYSDLWVEANKKRKELERQSAPRRPLLDRKEYWERELYRCNSLLDYKTFLKKCPSKFSDLLGAAQAKIREIEQLGKEEKLGCRKWLFLAIVVLLLPLLIKWLFS